jgi:glycosyltransferase involved in cell wall biosynthesis
VVSDAPAQHRPSVLVVAAAAPALGGIPTFAQLLTDSPHVRAVARTRLLNTTRVAVREAGTLSAANVAHAVTDVVRVLRAGRHVDVVHVHAAPGRTYPLLRMLALCAAARASGAGVICHVHSARINGGSPEGFSPGRVYRHLLRRLAFVDLVLTVSDTGTRVLQRLVPGTRVETLDNAVDVAAFGLARPDRDPAVLLFVGTLSVRKGLLDLFAAASRLRSRVAGWRLVVVGGPAEVGEREAGQVRAAAEAAGMADALVGEERDRALRDRLAAASALVLPSHWEGQPMVLLEAMASGLPVVATRVGAVPDVVRDGVDGLLVDAGDVTALAAAMERVVTSPELRRRWGAAAHARALERHDLPVLAARLGVLYGQVAERAAARRRRRRLR